MSINASYLVDFYAELSMSDKIKYRGMIYNYIDDKLNQLVRLNSNIAIVDGNSNIFKIYAAKFNIPVEDLNSRMIIPTFEKSRLLALKMFHTSTDMYLKNQVNVYNAIINFVNNPWDVKKFEDIINMIDSIDINKLSFYFIDHIMTYKLQAIDVINSLHLNLPVVSNILSNPWKIFRDCPTDTNINNAYIAICSNVYCEDKLVYDKLHNMMQIYARYNDSAPHLMNDVELDEEYSNKSISIDKSRPVIDNKDYVIIAKNISEDSINDIISQIISIDKGVVTIENSGNSKVSFDISTKNKFALMSEYGEDIGTLVTKNNEYLFIKEDNDIFLMYMNEDSSGNNDLMGVSLGNNPFSKEILFEDLDVSSEYSIIESTKDYSIE